jgi:hypothetical protein
MKEGKIGKTASCNNLIFYLWAKEKLSFFFFSILRHSSFFRFLGKIMVQQIIKDLWASFLSFPVSLGRRLRLNYVC